MIAAVTSATAAPNCGSGTVSVALSIRDSTRPNVSNDGTAGISGSRAAGTPAITRSSAAIDTGGSCGTCGVGRKPKSTLNGGSS